MEHTTIGLSPNLKQRVVGNPNPIKLGRCFDFLRGYYGIQHGGDRKSEMVKSKPNNSDLISNEDLANTYSVSVDTLENYVKLSKVISKPFTTTLKFLLLITEEKKEVVA